MDGFENEKVTITRRIKEIRTRTRKGEEEEE